MADHSPEDSSTFDLSTISNALDAIPETMTDPMEHDQLEPQWLDPALAQLDGNDPMDAEQASVQMLDPALAQDGGTNLAVPFTGEFEYDMSQLPNDMEMQNLCLQVDLDEKVELNAALNERVSQLEGQLMKEKEGKEMMAQEYEQRCVGLQGEVDRLDTYNKTISEKLQEAAGREAYMLKLEGAYREMEEQQKAETLANQQRNEREQLLTHDQASLHDKVALLEADKIRLEGDNMRLEGDKKHLEDDKKQLEEDMQQLEGDKQHLHRSFADLIVRYKELDGDKKQLDQSRDQLEGRYQQAVHAAEAARSQATESLRKGQVETMREQIDLANKVSRLETENMRLVGDKMQLKKHRDNAERELRRASIAEQQANIQLVGLSRNNERLQALEDMLSRCLQDRVDVPMDQIPIEDLEPVLSSVVEASSSRSESLSSPLNSAGSLRRRRRSGKSVADELLAVDEALDSGGIPGQYPGSFPSASPSCVDPTEERQAGRRHSWPRLFSWPRFLTPSPPRRLAVETKPVLEFCPATTVADISPVEAKPVLEIFPPTTVASISPVEVTPVLDIHPATTAANISPVDTKPVLEIFPPTTVASISPVEVTPVLDIHPPTTLAETAPVQPPQSQLLQALGIHLGQSTSTRPSRPDSVLQIRPATTMVSIDPEDPMQNEPVAQPAQTLEIRPATTIVSISPEDPVQIHPVAQPAQTLQIGPATTIVSIAPVDPPVAPPQVITITTPVAVSQQSRPESFPASLVVLLMAFLAIAPAVLREMIGDERIMVVAFFVEQLLGIERLLMG